MKYKQERKLNVGTKTGQSLKAHLLNRKWQKSSCYDKAGVSRDMEKQKKINVEYLVDQNVENDLFKNNEFRDKSIVAKTFDELIVMHVCARLSTDPEGIIDYIEGSFVSKPFCNRLFKRLFNCK